MKIGIMQPYFLPYIGYFQLISAVDKFIIYDNIKYTKKGWINRNRMLQNGKDIMFSLPLKSASDYLNVHARELASDFNRTRFLNQFKGSYIKAPYFDSTFALLEKIILFEKNNLFDFLHHSIESICLHLSITTTIIKSSTIDIDHTLKSQDKVLALCIAAGAKTYINAIGGLELYSKELFKNKGISLNFIQSNSYEYSQLDNEFIPWLSVIDVLMFNSVENVKHNVFSNYKLI